ncbi:MAG: Primary replicative DNA helicase [candidate division TM6 bacterium GW2011_GWE2_41_16]|nr:MAG: Primary replicative DNA helicase [candidate division TM6 bacterium GW2011_GWE2_41_16]
MQLKTIADRARIGVAERFLGKSLPHSIEAERSVLGALLLNDEHISLVVEILSPDDFYVPAHRIVYRTILDLHTKNSRVDSIILHDELKKTGELETIGGIEYLIALQEDIPALGLIEHHSRIIRQKSILRELITSASSIIATCYDRSDDEIDAVLDAAEKTIFNIAQKKSSQSFVQLTVWLKQTFQRLSEIKSMSKEITGIATGFKQLDSMTSGFQNGDLIVLAARPSMGKTALALRLAEQAVANGCTVGFFSLEMGADQLALRLLSAESRISYHSIRTASISSDEWMDLTSVAARLADQPLYIDDTPLQTIMDIRTKARRLKMEKGLAMIVIDYLQLINVTKKHENRHQEVSEISRSLKALAKELQIPIVALSQLSRAVDSRVDKRPLLSDLRESGAIEQDADLIMFLYRDVVYNSDTENPNSTELIVGKHRNGPTGTVHMHYQRELMLFGDFEDS